MEKYFKLRASKQTIFCVLLSLALVTQYGVINGVVSGQQEYFYSLGYTDLYYSNMRAIWYFGVILGALSLSYGLERFTLKTNAIFSACIYMTGFLLNFFSPTTFITIFSKLLEGWGRGALYALLIFSINHFIHSNNKTIFFGWTKFGGAFFSMICTFFVAKWSFVDIRFIGFSFLVLSIPFLFLIFCPQLILQTNQTPKNTNKIEALRLYWENKYILFMIILFALNWNAYSSLLADWGRAHGFDLVQSEKLTIFLYLGVVLFPVPLSFLERIYSKRFLFYIFYAFVSICLLIVNYINIFFAVALIYTLIGGVIMSGWPLIASLVGDRFQGQKLSIMTSGFLLVQTLVGIPILYMGGAVLEFAGPHIFNIAMFILNCVFLLAIYKSYPKEQTKDSFKRM